MNTKHLTMAISGLALFGAIHGTAQATIIINDNFSNDSLGTNTGAGAVGTGFVSVGQYAASESGGNAVIGTVSPHIYSTSVITSKDSFNPFLTGTTTSTTWAISSASISNSSYRTYVGLRAASNNGDHFLANAQGLYITIFQHSGDYLGPISHQGNLIASDHSGNWTILESWDWGFGNSTGPLSITLDTTVDSYSLYFSQGVTSATGALNGTLSGMGVLPTAFEVGAHGQWAGNTLAIDSITVATVSAVPSPSVPSLLVMGLAVMGLGRRFRRQ